MTLWDYLSTEEDNDVHSEEILNVLRRNDELGMGTQEIADEVGMSRQGVQNRLENLEEDGRVRSKEAGSLFWGLHPDERREPIRPEIDRLVHVFDRLREKAQPVVNIGGIVAIVGFSFIYIGLTGLFFSASNPLVKNGLLTAAGYFVTAAGGLLLVFSGGISVGTVAIERGLVQLIEKRMLSEQLDEAAHHGETRGQTTARVLLGLVVLLLIGGALVSAAADFYSGLAATPAFSPAEALLIASLFLAGLVAAVLGLGNSR